MKFSVIVPVYGVEKYLSECVNSILAQTYTDFEVILVDDKSPDNCPAICDSFCEKESRVSVIHKPKNEGLGFARNTGLQAASGDYVLFVDSDDTIQPTLLEECDRVIKNDEDIVVFGVNFCYENKDGKVKRVESAIPEVFFAQTAQEKAQMFAKLNNRRVFQYAWNKLYRRSFLRDSGVLFEKTPLIEDFLYNISLFPKASCIISVDKSYYNYRKPQHETLASKYSPEFFELCKRKYNLEKQFIEDCGSLDKFRPLINEMYIKHFVSAVLRNRSKSAALSRSQQKSIIRDMCVDSVTVEVINTYKPQGLKYEIICKSIKKAKVGKLLTLCIFIGLIKKFLNK